MVGHGEWMLSVFFKSFVKAVDCPQRSVFDRDFQGQVCGTTTRTKPEVTFLGAGNDWNLEVDA